MSDEMVVSQWSENAYYQYFCGGLEFTPKEPCDASELVHFRNRIGEKGMEVILAESSGYEKMFELYYRVLSQNSKSRNKE